MLLEAIADYCAGIEGVSHVNTSGVSEEFRYPSVISIAVDGRYVLTLSVEARDPLAMRCDSLYRFSPYFIDLTSEDSFATLRSAVEDSIAMYRELGI